MQIGGKTKMAGLALATATVLIGGCSDDRAVVASGGTGTVPDPGLAAEVRYEVNATVLESPEHGPELCLGVLDSYPPQCGSGHAVLGWSWEAAGGEQSANGTTWGEYHLVGTWDGDAFTLTEPAGAQEPGGPLPANFVSPCPEPQGGWTPVDPARTTFETWMAANEVAAALPGHAGAWVDQSPNPVFANEVLVGSEMAANDPLLLVLNVSTTGSVAEAEARIREVWGGALCVSAAQRTLADLERIANELDGPGLLSVSVNVFENRVDATLIAPDDTTQAEFDALYGAGTVVIDSWLQPVS